MRNFETQAEFKARLRRSFGRLSCGQRVYDIEDPRHVGTVKAITSRNVVIVRWDNGWIGEIELHNARRENGHAL